MAQLHRKFTDEQVKELIEKYLRKEVGRRYIQEILGINKTRFFALVKTCRENPDTFSIRYIRKGKTRAIPEAVEANILKELAIEKALYLLNVQIPLGNIRRLKRDSDYRGQEIGLFHSESYLP